jgi:hypothetical protein
MALQVQLALLVQAVQLVLQALMVPLALLVQAVQLALSVPLDRKEFKASRVM